MTREEAKREIAKVFEPAFANYIIKALTDGATESDVEPQGDLISREESKRINKALNIFRIWLKGQRTYVSREDAEYAYRTAIEYLNKYKPTVKQTEWISVKEHGNPKEDDDYWVTFVEVEDYDTDDKWIEVDIDSFCVKTQMWSHHNNADDKVVAWMPLPSPYKGE